MKEATKDMLITEIIEMDEGTADILMNAGMHCIGCMMAHGETLEQACEVHGIDPDEMITDINNYLGSK